MNKDKNFVIDIVDNELYLWLWQRISLFVIGLFLCIFGNTPTPWVIDIFITFGNRNSLVASKNSVSLEFYFKEGPSPWHYGIIRTSTTVLKCQMFSILKYLYRKKWTDDVIYKYFRNILITPENQERKWHVIDSDFKRVEFRISRDHNLSTLNQRKTADVCEQLCDK